MSAEDEGERMKSAIWSLMAVASLLVLATIAFSQEIRTDYDHHVNFSQYKTYSWAKVETPDSIWNERVKEAVDRALAAKGWTQVPSGGNVSIVAVGTTHEKPTLRTFYNGFDGWLWGGFGDATTYVENYEEGTLIVDMFDTSTKRLIWRSSASDVVSSKPEKNIRKLDRAVQKMFEHFPPALG
ncbi:MAG: DUF4136 domain-containing protein [Acidobacteria bacterium]|nr:MAG: DUF4136 domain-containing protein [Acidobacteriota bacterium]